ncbi:MAG TPA: rod shape-determining protein RodA [Allosphingosinicella sp.]|jgi:rod shape determining protein RodA
MNGPSLIPAPIAELPWRMLSLVIFITFFGLLVLYSAASGHLMPWALPQGVRFLVFLVMAILMSRLKVDRIRAAAFPAYGMVMVLLLLVEALGFVGKGAQRWLSLGFVNLQPSELMKVAIILALARFYDLLPVGELRRWAAIWPAAILLGVPALFILVQPDLGTAVMVVAGAIVIMFLAGLPLRLFLGGIAAISVAGPIAFSFLHPYQRQRVLIFLNPESDPRGAGYHISQSKIAIGSGGIFGKGFLNGTQSHLQYLPENHTDFIFATMAEEWGLAGGIVLIVAYAFVIKWGIGVALDAKDRFARLTAAGLTFTIFFYVAINLLMVMGLAPVVGIPLPLVSYGGSAMLTVMLCLGILMSIDRANRRPGRGLG